MKWDRQDSRGYTPLMLAAFHDNAWLVRYIIDEVEVHPNSESQRTKQGAPVVSAQGRALGFVWGWVMGRGWDRSGIGASAGRASDKGPGQGLWFDCGLRGAGFEGIWAYGPDLGLTQGGPVVTV